MVRFVFCLPVFLFAKASERTHGERLEELEATVGLSRHGFILERIRLIQGGR